MSFPTVPNITPSINIRCEEVVNLLLASIAFEELGLAHIINAEAEKIQFILGTLPGQTTSTSPTFGALVSINRSVESILRTVIKQQMLLQFKLEDVMEATCPSTNSSTTTRTATTATTTTTTETTTTTTETTTTTTAETFCPPGLGLSVFANNNLSVASQSVIEAGTHVNGNMTVTHSGNNFSGNTKVVGTFTDSSGGNSYQKLILNSAPSPFEVFDPDCLHASADLIINGNVNISSEADAAIFQNRTVWVNGTVTISGENISITGGGIQATGGIAVSGGNFTYNSTGYFALYSQVGDISINNGPYTIAGLIYTAQTGGDIRLATSQGGKVFGAVISGKDVIFSGGSAVHEITITRACNPCQS